MKTFFSFFKYFLTLHWIRAFKSLSYSEDELDLQEFVDNPPMVCRIRPTLFTPKGKMRSSLKKIMQYPDGVASVAGIDFSNRETRSIDYIIEWWELEGGQEFLVYVKPKLSSKFNEIGVYNVPGIRVEDVSVQSSWYETALERFNSVVASRYREEIKDLVPKECPNCGHGDWVYMRDGYCDECTEKVTIPGVSTDLNEQIKVVQDKAA